VKTVLARGLQFEEKIIHFDYQQQVKEEQRQTFWSQWPARPSNATFTADAWFFSPANPEAIPWNG
jgi:hypothetical protein